MGTAAGLPPRRLQCLELYSLSGRTAPASSFPRGIRINVRTIYLVPDLHLLHEIPCLRVPNALPRRCLDALEVVHTELDSRWSTSPWRPLHATDLDVLALHNARVRLSLHEPMFWRHVRGYK